MTRLSIIAALMFTSTSIALAAVPETIGIDLSGIDPTVAPGDGFDAHVNGGWRKQTEIPADRASIGSFMLVGQIVERRNAEIVSGIGKANPASGTDARRIADYYAAFLDTGTIEKKGLSPLRPMLERIDAIADKRGLSTALGATMRTDTDPLNFTTFWTESLFGLFVTQALQDPSRTVPYLLQGGLGMPGRDYYLSGAPEMAKLRQEYGAYVAEMMTLLGMPDAGPRAARVVALETKIAHAHADAVSAQDAKAPREWTRADFATRAPGIDWDAYFQAAQLGDQQDFIAWHPAPIAGLAALVDSEPLDVWKDWLAFHTASRHAAVLPKDFDDLRFRFYGKTLAGTMQQRPRDRRAIAATSAAMGDAVGRIYVSRHFTPEAKADVETLARNIMAAFGRRLAAIDWMAPATKAEAQRKLEKLTVSVGYPDRWQDYSALEVRPDDAFGNFVRAQAFEYRRQLSKIGKPVDRAEWWMFPHTANAIFLPLQNAMSFPAGLLEPPFYDPKADPAFNYGAIGSVIGHEISHSFDNGGADFDADGRVRNWWTPEDLARFEKAGEALAKQYSAYQAFPGLNLNGQLTLGENISDLAGLAAAYDAYRASLGGKPAPVINGLTGDQRFFIAYGQSRREHSREAALRGAITSGIHAPGRWRAETVRNHDAWYPAFAVKPGQKLYLAPSDRVRIW